MPVKQGRLSPRIITPPLTPTAEMSSADHNRPPLTLTRQPDKISDRIRQRNTVPPILRHEHRQRLLGHPAVEMTELEPRTTHHRVPLSATFRYDTTDTGRRRGLDNSSCAANANAIARSS